MKSGLNKKLFFSMTFDFLTIYIPQDSSSSKTVKTYRDGLTIFRRYVTDVKNISIRAFTFEQCTFDFVLECILRPSAAAIPFLSGRFTEQNGRFVTIDYHLL